MRIIIIITNRHPTSPESSLTANQAEKKAIMGGKMNNNIRYHASKAKKES